MTPAEHAKVWRKVVERMLQITDDADKMGAKKNAIASLALTNFSDAIATAYEQAAKEREGRG